MDLDSTDLVKPYSKINNDLAEALNRGSQVDVILLDLHVSKAFDTVLHNRLVHKLRE